MQEALESVGICKSIEQINNSLTWETHQQQTTWNYGLQQRLFVYCTPKSVWTLLRIIGLVKYNMSTEFNVSPFKIFGLITLEVNSKIIYDKETKHTLMITFTLLLIGPEACYTDQLKTLKTICGQSYMTVSCWRQKTFMIRFIVPS